MAKEKKAFPLRLDPDVHRAVEAWAADEFRSVNAHIEYLLREALQRSGRLKGRPSPGADADAGAHGRRGSEPASDTD